MTPKTDKKQLWLITYNDPVSTPSAERPLPIQPLPKYLLFSASEKKLTNLLHVKQNVETPLYRKHPGQGA